MVIANFEKFTTPFVHYIFKNYLSDDLYTKVATIYNSLSFYEKHSDLYKFLQTNELKEDFSLQFFIKELINTANYDLKTPLIEKFDLFASYYRKGDYLLCHDDFIDTRRLAFSYYLENFNSGELVMFNNDANKEVKRLEIKANTLVIFEVSPINFHEVAFCKENGRKAFTGWLHYNLDQLNILENTNYKKNFVQIQENYLIKIENLDISVKSFKVEIDETFLEVLGPFFEKKVTKIIGSNVVFNIEGYQILYKESYKINEGDYILLTNNLTGDNLLHVFYFKSKVIVPVVKFVNSNGEVEFEIETINDQLFFVKGIGRSWFIERSLDSFIMEYWVYKLKI